MSLFLANWHQANNQQSQNRLPCATINITAHAACATDPSTTHTANTTTEATCSLSSRATSVGYSAPMSRLSEWFPHSEPGVEPQVHDWLVSMQRPHGISALHHLKPLELAKFSRNAQQFVRWSQSFKRLVDEDRYVSDDYKLARLKEALQGSSAEDIVAQMFDGPGAYCKYTNFRQLFNFGYIRHRPKTPKLKRR